MKLKNQSKYAHLLHWGKLISITGGAQVIVQAVGFVSGILIIRLLPVEEYAFYTLANTMLGTMTILSDGGISVGVMSQGGKVWQDKEKLGVVLATGLDLRHKFAIFSLLISMPILFYLLIDNNASYVTALLITLSLIPAFYAALSDSLLQIVPKLHQSIPPLQKNQIEVGVGRLLLTALTIFVFPWAFIVILASGVPRVWGNFRLRKITYALADKNQLPDKQIRADILKLVKRIMPESIYYCLSGQITIWLISIFGDTSSIAELGALSRLNMVLSLFSVLITTLVIPRFAKLPLDKNILLKRFIQIMLGLVVLTTMISTLAYSFPQPLLWILGTAYKGLNYELFLSVLGSCISLLIGGAYSLMTSRGWAVPPFILISINLLTIVAFASFLDLSSLKGVLFFNIAVNLIVLLQTVFFCTFKIIKIKE